MAKSLEGHDDEASESRTSPHSLLGAKADTMSSPASDRHGSEAGLSKMVVDDVSQASGRSEDGGDTEERRVRPRIEEPQEAPPGVQQFTEEQKEAWHFEIGQGVNDLLLEAVGVPQMGLNSGKSAMDRYRAQMRATLARAGEAVGRAFSVDALPSSAAPMHILLSQPGPAPPEQQSRASHETAQPALPQSDSIPPSSRLHEPGRSMAKPRAPRLNKGSRPEQPVLVSAGAPGDRTHKARLPLILQPGVVGLRAPVLAVNWVHKMGGRVKVQPGTYPAILLDRNRIHESVQRELVKLGYNPEQHDPVLFFSKDREAHVVTTEYGISVKDTSLIWSRQAYLRAEKADRALCYTFQWNVENELGFNWLQCDDCKKWRLYPSLDLTFPKDGMFLCGLCQDWNPGIRGCESEEEFSADSEK